MLNIKRPEVHELAQTLARRTGQTLTGAVWNSLRDSVARLPPEPEARIDLAAVREITKRTSRLMRKGRKFRVEDLYDPKTGLPK